MSMTETGLKLNGHMTFRRGQKVKVLSHTHPDVLAGTVGKIDCTCEDGYGVEITGLWEDPLSARGQMVKETRVTRFAAQHLQAL